jgi:hypothetical protein
LPGDELVVANNLKNALIFLVLGRDAGISMICDEEEREWR